SSGPQGGGEDEAGEPVRQVRGPGRAPCALRRTREKDHLATLGKLSVGGSLQPTSATRHHHCPSRCSTPGSRRYRINHYRSSAYSGGLSRRVAALAALHE